MKTILTRNKKTLGKLLEFSLISVLWKRTISVEFRANRLKLCENCAFPQNVHTKKSGEITVFYVVKAGHSEISSAKLNWSVILSHKFENRTGKAPQIVHELEPEKMGFWLRRLKKHVGLFRVSTISKSMMSCPNRKLSAKNWGVLQSRMDQRGDLLNMNFTIFKFWNECYKHLERKK